MPVDLPGVSITKGVSINSTKQPSSEPQVVQESYENQAVREDVLRVKWLEFANTQEGFLAQTLRSSIPTLKGDAEILITLHNGIQKEKLEGIYPILIPFLRKELSNSEVSVTIRVEENQSKTSAFTPKEKITEMIKENPALGTLIEKFGLEID